MKKTISLIIIGILILSSIGVVATTNEKEKTNPEPLIEPYIEIVAKGGFGVIVTITNYNETTPFEIPTTIKISLNGAFILIGKVGNFPVPIPIPPGEQSVKVKTGLVFGIGLCTVTVAVDLYNDEEIDAEESISGFIIGPFVIIGTLYVPLP
jgi:hypothetical protein